LFEGTRLGALASLEQGTMNRKVTRVDKEGKEKREISG